MITIYFGKSASGKDYFLKKLIRHKIQPIISYTTRPIRDNETNGIDYNFVTNKEFKDLIKNNKLMEYREYNTLVNNKPDIWYYGSPILDLTKDYAGVFDINGIKKYIEYYGSENIDLVYVDIPDDSIREARAKQRGSFDKTEWDRRKLDDDIAFSKEKISELIKLYKKPIMRINNNSDKPLFSWIES